MLLRGWETGRREEGKNIDILPDAFTYEKIERVQSIFCTTPVEISRKFLENSPSNKNAWSLASHIRKDLPSAITPNTSESPVKQMSFAACPEGHQIQCALAQAMKELVPEAEAISDDALPVTFKKITRDPATVALLTAAAAVWPRERARPKFRLRFAKQASDYQLTRAGFGQVTLTLLANGVPYHILMSQQVLVAGTCKSGLCEKTPGAAPMSGKHCSSCP
ncbi:hypothetical protein WISP_119737 [Willisornis vidua]|uniref:Uncharacterized protein n=1 Tax=Willisornis vidua TaxID=1566151 RepID=A0ABQ9CYU1_9PASS|nr:hypothetical protein WISP_119737 [Willisornis vidua]